MPDKDICIDISTLASPNAGPQRIHDPRAFILEHGEICPTEAVPLRIQYLECSGNGMGTAKLEETITITDTRAGGEPPRIIILSSLLI